MRIATASHGHSFTCQWPANVIQIPVIRTRMIAGLATIPDICETRSSVRVDPVTGPRSRNDAPPATPCVKRKTPRLSTWMKRSDEYSTAGRMLCDPAAQVGGGLGHEQAQRSVIVGGR